MVIHSGAAALAPASNESGARLVGPSANQGPVQSSEAAWQTGSQPSPLGRSSA